MGLKVMGQVTVFVTDTHIDELEFSIFKDQNVKGWWENQTHSYKYYIKAACIFTTLNVLICNFNKIKSYFIRFIN